MRLAKPQRTALPTSDFAGPGRSFPVNDAAHAKAAIMLSGHAAPADRPRIVAKAERVLHGGRAEGGMVEERDDTPDQDDDDMPERDPRMELGQAMYDHINARGQNAAEVPEDQRTPEDWADIAHHFDTFGDVEGDSPNSKMHRAVEALQKRTGHGLPSRNTREEPAPKAKAEEQAAPEGRKAGGMVEPSAKSSAHKGMALLMMIHPGMGKPAGAGR
jgi:hypothetical protein